MCMKFNTKNQQIHFSVGRKFEEVVRATQKQHKGELPETDSEILKNSTNNSWSRLKNKIDVIKNMRKSEPIDTGRIIEEVFDLFVNFKLGSLTNL